MSLTGPRAALAAGVVFLLASAAADARPSETGIFAEIGLGGAGFVGHAAPHTKPGLSVSARVGYDLFPWLSAGVAAIAATHEATVPPPPERQHLQIYGAAAELRIARPSGRLIPYASGGAGAALMSTNALQRVGLLEPEQRESLMISGGAGVEYQLQDRHYAVGAGGQWALFPGYADAQFVSGRAYLRYTF